MNLLIQVSHFIIYRHFKVVFFYPEPNQHITGLFQFRCHYLFLLRNIHRKGYQCRRYVNLVKSTRHTVFSAYGRQSETDLRIIGTQQGRKRLAPSGRFGGHPAEILLECETYGRVIPSGSHNPCHGFHNRVNCPVVRTPGGKKRIKATTHHGDSIRPALQNRKLRNHGLGLRELMLSSVGHQHAARAYGGVKHLHQTLLRAHIQVMQQFQPCPAHISFFQLPACRGNGPFVKIIILFIRNVHFYPGLLMCAVGIQKSPF